MLRPSMSALNCGVTCGFLLMSKEASVAEVFRFMRRRKASSSLQLWSCLTDTALHSRTWKLLKQDSAI